MKKHFLAPDQKHTKRKIKRSIENCLNKQTQVNKSTYLKTALRNKVITEMSCLKTMANSIGFEKVGGE